MTAGQELERGMLEPGRRAMRRRCSEFPFDRKRVDWMVDSDESRRFGGLGNTIRCHHRSSGLSRGRAGLSAALLGVGRTIVRGWEVDRARRMRSLKGCHRLSKIHLDGMYRRNRPRRQSRCLQSRPLECRVVGPKNPLRSECCDSRPTRVSFKTNT